MASRDLSENDRSRKSFIGLGIFTGLLILFAVAIVANHYGWVHLS